MANYDLLWNPNRLEQRVGRIHRIGQTEVCHRGTSSPTEPGRATSTAHSSLVLGSTPGKRLSRRDSRCALGSNRRSRCIRYGQSWERSSKRKTRLAPGVASAEIAVTYTVTTRRIRPRDRDYRERRRDFASRTPHSAPRRDRRSKSSHPGSGATKTCFALFGRQFRAAPSPPGRPRAGRARTAYFRAPSSTFHTPSRQES